ncbi:MAG: type II toxin-antitoxin system HicA family toxin [Sutterellaceae bacterium]|nr:type II toxin-antitoxin system HicA family toxin [Burkholderiaceae bacterium]MDW8429959.1 type II toxin-antitoxin system HicA family toxin [Sutterellaceae bacterium]
MGRRHANTLRTVFHDPPSGNLHWREVESLLRHLGADIESVVGARVRVRLNGVEEVLHRPHHSNVLDISAIKHLREFLARAGMTPAAYEAANR